MISPQSICLSEGLSSRAAKKNEDNLLLSEDRPLKGIIFIISKWNTNKTFFKRIYVCIGALKRGFKEGLRELLGLDGCFMKGQYPGQLLTADKKGIQAAIAQVFPNAEHRFCVRHIYENFKAQWKGNQFKELVWKCAAATTVQRYLYNIGRAHLLWNGGTKYQATGPFEDQCVVDIEEKKCSYRKWELTGMPCKHAVAVINEMVTTNADVGVPDS
ncbi:mutator type transposase [Tanacetum coccineum]|uniref:Mutator type transposase n=1 Tax=Tanacetum coccineum TaxID=301880 RepID=A0ABQ5GUA9_9ASTR